jgi:hypothetical protein
MGAAVVDRILLNILRNSPNFVGSKTVESNAR